MEGLESEAEKNRMTEPGAQSPLFPITPSHLASFLLGLSLEDSFDLFNQFPDALFFRIGQINKRGLFR
jgi:hypothetical protein